MENVLNELRPGVYSTYCVIRKFRLDVDGFEMLPLPEREKAVGRRQADGSPLSGGSTMSEVNLTARTATGEYATPLGSHARAAHPSFTGSKLMLRRSYAFVDNADEASGKQKEGLVFTSFQKDLRTFIETQKRIDEKDDMMKYAFPEASFSFLIVSGGEGIPALGV